MMRRTLVFLLAFLFNVVHAQQNSIDFCQVPKVTFQKIDFTFCNVPASDDYSFGICWDEKPNPTLFNNFRIFNQTNERFVSSIQNLKPNRNYYFRVFQLFKNGQVNYYPEFVETTLPEVKIGDYYQGGVVAYIFSPKDSLYIAGEQHGLIIAKEDLGFASWGNQGKATENGTNVKLGYGKTNTESIVAQYPNSLNQNNSVSTLKIVHPCAAILCHNYQSDGYKDWFLPSNAEWHAIFPKYDSLAFIKLNSQDYYWSSSEVFLTWQVKKSKKKETKTHYRSSWAVRFHSQSLVSSAITRKNAALRVRAMRYF